MKAVVEVVDAMPEDRKNDKPALNNIVHGILANYADVLDNVEGFAAFYQLVHGNDLPNHARRWVDQVYKAHEQGKGCLIEGFRGSWKTSVFITFMAYRIGKDPARANLNISANDDSANKITRAVADIVENNPAWELVFGVVQADKERGWGEQGYEVKDGRYDYSSWRKLNAARKDPSMLGLGIRSGSLIGKHPDGVLWLDDIHDEENTRSARERQAVVQKFQETIMPFIVEDEQHGMITWLFVTATPWTEDDVYAYMEATGEFVKVMTPAIVEAEEDDEGAVWVQHTDDITGWWQLAWPEKMGVDAIKTWRNRTGSRGFARMFRLDLIAARVSGLKYFVYPSEKIEVDKWRAGGGVDFASIRDRMSHEETKNRDLFAMAYGMELPTGGAVIFDGVAGKFTQLEGEEIVEKAQALFGEQWAKCVVEDIGKGEGFVDVLMRKSHLKIHPMHSTRPKRLRFEQEMAPWLEIGLLKISDADTPFLNLLRKALDDYPNGNDDVLDAVYWYGRGIPHILHIREPADELPKVSRAKKPNPFLALGRA